MRRFEFTVEEQPDGTLSFNATNSGFTPYELLGFLDVERHSVMEQVIHKELFDRTVVYPDGRVMKIEDKETKK